MRIICTRNMLHLMDVFGWKSLADGTKRIAWHCVDWECFEPTLRLHTWKCVRTLFGSVQHWACSACCVLRLPSEVAVWILMVWCFTRRVSARLLDESHLRFFARTGGQCWHRLATLLKITPRHHRLFNNFTLCHSSPRVGL